MKMKTQQPKCMGHSKSSPNGEIHGIEGLPQETRKISNEQSNVIFRESKTTTTTTNKAQSE